VPTFELIATRKIVVKEGWGVDVTPIYADEDGDYDEKIVDINVSICHIVQENVKEVGGAWCLGTQTLAGKWSGFYVPVENFQFVPDLNEDDTHDLRTRWFATEDDARAHAETVKSRWEHPEVWESFVCLH
jgi:hypothetical protein